jgi:hypothetical protein
MKIVYDLTGMAARECFYDRERPWNLESVREAVAKGGHYEAIGLFSIVYDGFGPEFESFVRNDQARRNSGKGTRQEPEMAEWCQMLAEVAEHYREALLCGDH